MAGSEVPQSIGTPVLSHLQKLGVRLLINGQAVMSYLVQDKTSR